MSARGASGNRCPIPSPDEIALFARAKLKDTRLPWAETISAQMIYLVIGLSVEGVGTIQYLRGRLCYDGAGITGRNVREQGHSLSSILQCSRLTCSVSFEPRAVLSDYRGKRWVVFSILCEIFDRDPIQVSTRLS